MDGGYLEAEMMAKAGASFVVVMGRAHEATIRRVIDAGRDFNCKVMGDNLGADDRVANAKWLADPRRRRRDPPHRLRRAPHDQGPQPDGRARRGRGRRRRPGAGGRRTVDQAGDRMSGARRRARRARRAARHRRRCVQAGEQQAARHPRGNLRRDPQDAVQGDATRRSRAWIRRFVRHRHSVIQYRD